MGNLNKIYAILHNRSLMNDIKNIVRIFKAERIFNYIDLNLINLETVECINFGNDLSGLTDYYQMLNIFDIDPFINQFAYTRKQTYHFKELEFSQIKMQNSSLRVGVVLNEERSKRFFVHNGMYRTIQINHKYCFVCVYGCEKKDFMFDIDFSLNTQQGQWFRLFEFALIDVTKKYLNEIENYKEGRNVRY